MSAPAMLRRLRPWPRTLGTRLFLILLIGLALAYTLSFTVLFTERDLSARTVMLDTLENDVGTAVAILDRLPAPERPDWLARLSRGTYRFELGPGLPGAPDTSRHGAEIAASIRDGAGERSAVRMEAIPGGSQRLQAHLTLSDGELLTIDIHPALAPLASWLPYVLVLQLALLAACSWFGVRLAIRPLVRLTRAADTLDPGRKAPRLAETGPREVAQAASAFNAMRERISHYLEERVRILAAISHDLQTPITRMKLRAEMADEGPARDKLLQDLDEIERLVREGIAYARSAHGNTEKPTWVDIAAFVESLVFDYQDTGKAVSLESRMDARSLTRPHALRRVLGNLIDNALKFGGRAAIRMETGRDGKLVIKVQDRGPGIPEGELEAVLQPFYRLEQSRNRETGGTGLGLAIAHQLAAVLGGGLALRNREDGGLSAEVTLD